ncbi:hypothetical protein B0H66DRAFT_619415 [Apodospora peruviana]|uniref:Uncharacterized protein n=1 Tax=Apodospora peruviana TaxID=516989 RepID=A0AAE0IBI0_9PEZI|nr:hypothetical protein B0H66DRAFT_619415 [Apodospora peruviana]
MARILSHTTRYRIPYGIWYGLVYSPPMHGCATAPASVSAAGARYGKWQLICDGEEVLQAIASRSLPAHTSDSALAEPPRCGQWMSRRHQPAVCVFSARRAGPVADDVVQPLVALPTLGAASSWLLDFQVGRPGALSYLPYWDFLSPTHLVARVQMHGFIGPTVGFGASGDIMMVRSIPYPGYGIDMCLPGCQWLPYFQKPPPTVGRRRNLEGALFPEFVLRAYLPPSISSFHRSFCRQAQSTDADSALANHWQQHVVLQAKVPRWATATIENRPHWHTGIHGNHHPAHTGKLAAATYPTCFDSPTALQLDWMLHHMQAAELPEQREPIEQLLSHAGTPPPISHAGRPGPVVRACVRAHACGVRLPTLPPH